MKKNIDGMWLLIGAGALAAIYFIFMRKPAAQQTTQIITTTTPIKKETNILTAAKEFIPENKIVERLKSLTA